MHVQNYRTATVNWTMQFRNRILSFSSHMKFWDVLSVINLVPASLCSFVPILERHGCLNADATTTSELGGLDQMGLTEENMIQLRLEGSWHSSKLKLLEWFSEVEMSTDKKAIFRPVAGKEVTDIRAAKRRSYVSLSFRWYLRATLQVAACALS